MPRRRARDRWRGNGEPASERKERRRGPAATAVTLTAIAPPAALSSSSADSASSTRRAAGCSTAPGAPPTSASHMAVRASASLSSSSTRVRANSAMANCRRLRAAQSESHSAWQCARGTTRHAGRAAMHMEMQASGRSPAEANSDS